MKLTLEERIAHGGHPVLRWMMDNIFVKTDPAGNIKPDKEKSTERIDGAIVLIMALDRVLRHGGENAGSVYDETIAYCNTIGYNICRRRRFEMARTANIFARVEPEIKEQAEKVLEQLGISMSNAIGLFLRQVVLQRGIPFDMKLPQNKPLCIEELSEEQFNVEIEKGMADLNSGKVIPAEKVFDRISKDYGL